MSAGITWEARKRMEAFTGHLSLPNRDRIVKVLGKDLTTIADRMFTSLWRAYIRNKGTISLPYWADQFQNPVAMNKLLKALSDANWITCVTVPSRNWSEASLNEDKLLSFLSMEELESIRSSFKFSKYHLKLEEEATENNRVRLNGRTTTTGLVREGFRKSGNTKFSFDTAAIQYHYDVILAEVNKGMSKIAEKYPELRSDKASYDEISKDVLDHIMFSGDEALYSSGQNDLDSRGRNIHGMLDKVFNPVSFKVARACLVIPMDFRNRATSTGLQNKYLFIAEVLGFKKGTIADKVRMGREAYYKSTFLDLDYSKEGDRKEAFENIWLDRTYLELDKYFQISTSTNRWKNRCNADRCTIDEAQTYIEATPLENFYWSVPIEIDMSALTF